MRQWKAIVGARGRLDRAVRRGRILVALAAAAGLLPVAAGAGPGPVEAKVYCIVGNGSGDPWNWEVRVVPDVLLAGQSSGTMGAPADVRDEFVASIESARTAAGKIFPTAFEVTPTPSTCSGAAFKIQALVGFDLYVSSPPPPAIPQPSVDLQLVTSPVTAAVFFNPAIYIPVPEPGVLPMLVSGAVGLAALHRRRSRRAM